MDSLAETGKHDLLIVIDATASMEIFLKALRKALPEIVALSLLSGTFKRIGIIAYQDYCDDQVINWSRWNRDGLMTFAGSLSADGGGDYPEAAKSALAKALEEVNSVRHTLVLWYTDAPPHHPSQPESGNRTLESKAFPGRSIDWVHLSYEARAKNCTVFSFVSFARVQEVDVRYYALLSQVTGGMCLNFEREPTDSSVVSQLTLDVLLTWLGQPPAAPTPHNAEARHPSRALVTTFDTPPPIGQHIKDELDSQGYLPVVNRHLKLARSITTKHLDLALQAIPRSDASSIASLTALAKHFANTSNVNYRQIVYKALGSIIEHNVVALSYNPIFGQLWRAVCKENSVEKEELTNAFSLHIGKITDATKREEMKAFVENSYDATEHIEEMINKAPKAGTPRMYLDLDSLGHGAVDMTRMELLEVSRSCHSKVMAKLATIFTHVKLAPPELMLGPNQRYIPLSLPPQGIFQLMPHLVIPGTMFSARPACIMAILSMIIGVQFLREPALEVLSRFKGKWLDVKVPENLSYEFARFVLLEGSNAQDVALWLTDEEKTVYQGMRRYRLLELNLQSETTARVPWKPEKSRGIGDDKVDCRKCYTLRSKTMMRDDPPFKGVCGICADPSDMKLSDWPDEGDDQSCWVECSVQTCRAQYVVVNSAALRVRPKCWYCRNKKPCPFVECINCRSRVIIPKQLRAPGVFTCIACTNGTWASIVDVVTEPQILIKENGVEWLGLKAKDDLFQGKSAFRLFEAHSGDFFLNQPSLSKSPPSITLESRFVHNAPSILAKIEELVNSGTVDMGTCTLCFESIPHSKLLPSCGRSGCNQRVDGGCLSAWYGANQPGHLLNLMRTLCPFCRRKPTARTLTKFNPPIAALGGLQEAMNDRAWYYAWCLSCGFARRALERVCCEGERLPNIVNFRCDGCQAAPVQVPGSMGTARITPCPTCGVMVEKTDGCNHITCVCGAHWCHVCGGAFQLDEIYDHMSVAHGGFYDDDEEEYW